MHAGLARQPRHPAGLAGQLVGLMMNRRNRRTITAAVDAPRRFRDEIADGRLSLHAAPLTDLPLRVTALDGAITINTIYFIADQHRAFSELARVLQGSGHAVIGVADPECMSGLPTTPHRFRLRPAAEVMDAATRAGLHVDEDRRIGPDPHPYHLLVVGPAPSAVSS